jgi:hypothetical protein
MNTIRWAEGVSSRWKTAPFLSYLLITNWEIEMKTLFVLLLVSCALLSVGFAQTRKSVSGAEVTGTFRSYYKGKFKGNFNEIKILALGKGKLKISFGLTYPFTDGTGGLDANVGEAEGTADIDGDTAVFSSKDNDELCKITIRFVKQGQIKVRQDGSCGFGLNVSADGTYQKISNAKPKFE